MVLESKYLYLALNVIILGIPLILSFDKKVAYFRRWRYLFPSIVIMALIFIFWDVVFTKFEIWGFNERYLVGINIINLPIEEWLFFITVPFASVFIYDCVKYYFTKLNVSDAGNIIAVFLGIFLAILALLNLGRHYTYITFISLALILLLLVIRKSGFLGHFFVTYLIILVPFFIINGILTGTWISEPVVWYNDNFNLDFRLWTVPIEDLLYGMLLILGNVAFYEHFQLRSEK
jgi:lycopene cyclase domain-containing protein